MSGKIFISYRRGDDPGYTQAIFQQFEAEFGHAQLFMDVQGYLAAGDDFLKVLKAQVASCDVLLAIIGPRWIEARDDKGGLRLNHADDFVRIEILSALQLQKRVIPVLVNNAAMPRVEDLPEPLKPLAHRHAARLTHERFLADCRSLVDDVRKALEAAAAVQRTEPARRESSPPALADKPDFGTVSAKNPKSNLIFGLIFIVLAGLSSWVSLTFLYDKDVSRVLLALFAASTFFFAFVGFVALLRAIGRA